MYFYAESVKIRIKIHLKNFQLKVFGKKNYFSKSFSHIRKISSSTSSVLNLEKE